jgi:hypothetical protein
MTRGPKRKTATVTLRLDPLLKAAAKRAADRDRRSLTNFIEVLIEEHCRTLEIEINTAQPGGR